MTELRETLIRGFLRSAGWGDAERRMLAQDASFRRYERLVDGDRRAVLMDAPPPLEDVRPFIAVGRHLRRLGLSAPEILAEDAETGLLLLEDLGDDTFTRLIAAGADEHALYALAVDTLATLHGSPEAAALDLPPYDEERLLAEARLLVDWYLPAVLQRPASAGEAESYADAWREVLSEAAGAPCTLVLRDYHVDNLVRLPARGGVAACGLLDFQDAVRGPASYDLVSLLEDARRDVPPHLATRMLERYLGQLPSVERETYLRSYRVLGTQRHAKVIGIFTRLAHRDRKPGYLRHIPRLWRLLERSLDDPLLRPVRSWLDHHLPADRRRVPEPH